MENNTSDTSSVIDQANANADPLIAVKLTCLSVISFVGIAGNLLICATLLGHKRKSSECFIFNLAITDLMVCAIGIPLDIYEMLHGAIYGPFPCKVVWPSQTLLVLVSILTLTAMSLERHRAIITPLKPKLKKADIIKAICIIWVLGIAVVCPYIHALNYNGVECIETWPGARDPDYYTLALFIIDYCIPLTIIAYCYARVGYRLYTSNLQFNGSPKLQHLSSIQRDARRKRLHRNTRIIKVFSFAVVMFMLCMLPGDIFWMWKTWGRGTFNYEDHFRTFSNILLYANSAINPFIFGTCNFECMRAFCLRKMQPNSSYSLRVSFTSSLRKRRAPGENSWRRVARKLREKDKKLTTIIIWESNV